MAESPPVLEALGLVKSYGGQRVVNELALEARAGRVLGLLGPNGAGKTTTLRMLYGLIKPEDGTILYGGKDFAEHRTAIKRTIGVCTQEDTLDYDFTVVQNLRVYASYFRPSVQELEPRIAELLELFGLTEYAKASPHTLSGGYKRRLLIARSVVHRPDVLFLDEPTTGLDPRARVDVWDLVHAMRRQGMAIVLTTHYMDEAERLSDELLVLDKGRDVARGAPRTIIRHLLGDHVVVIRPDHPRHAEVQRWVAAALSGPPLKILGELHLPMSSAQLVAFTDAFTESPFEVRPPTLDDLFLKLALPDPGASPALEQG